MFFYLLFYGKQEVDYVINKYNEYLLCLFLSYMNIRNYITFLYRNVDMKHFLNSFIMFLFFLFFGSEAVYYDINKNYDGITHFFLHTGFEIKPCKYNEFYNHY